MRVIAGRFKGLELKAPKSGTRPTTDRTKEAIFSRLESWGVLDDSRVLDLFAGTGALGVEALSRGARELVAVESAAQAASLISGTFAALRRQRAWEKDMSATLVRKRAEQYVSMAAERANAGGAASVSGNGLSKNSAKDAGTISGGDSCAEKETRSVSVRDRIVAPFDVIFIDPPYAFTTEACESLLNDLVASGMAVEGTVIVLERSTRSEEPTPPVGWQITDRRDYGETAVFYIESAETETDKAAE